jgi:hypothetical protein
MRSRNHVRQSGQCIVIGVVAQRGKFVFKLRYALLQPNICAVEHFCRHSCPLVRWLSHAELLTDHP